MSHQNKYIIVCFLVLLINNIVLAILFFNKINKADKLVSAEILLAKNAASYNASIGRSDIINLFDSIDFQMDSVPNFAIFVPPYPCDACLDEQISIVQKRINNNMMILVAPDYRERDLRVQFSDYPMQVIGYDPKLIPEDNPAYCFDGIIICTFIDGIISDSFLTNKVFPNLSELIFDRLLL